MASGLVASCAALATLSVVLGCSGSPSNERSPVGTAGGSSATPPSCVDLPATCAGEHKDCCASQPVPGGSFQLDNETDPVFATTISDFRLDTYEVTVARFRQFAAGYPGTLPAAGSGKNTSNPSDPGWDPAWNALMPVDEATLVANVQCDAAFQTWGRGDELAMNCVTWFEANAFCIWDAGRLPTDAEWNYAAAGGAEQRVYPWSQPPSNDAIDSSFAVFAPATDVAPVGSKAPRGDGKYGQSDLAGNVWEWVQDWYVPYPQSTCDNCATLVEPPDTSERVIRGGSSYDSYSYLNSFVLDVYDPTTRLNYIGFRCARNR
ncbi:MAG: SUMF1/EgtB/PvdO family nonheme iron enzyme [Myxococcales bacterium]